MLTDFFKQQSDAKTLASPKLRVLNNKAASINVGDKQPILLSTTNVLPGQAATGAVPTTSTVTSIEYKDVGVKLTVEPSINALDEIAMKLKIEVTRLGDQVILQASPEIKQFKFGTRMAETFLMMRNDETIVLGGLIQGEDRKNRSTIPILGDIPYLGELFSATTVDRVETEVVLTITPRIVRSLTTPPIANQAFWSGTDQNYSTTQLFPPRVHTVSQSTGSSMSSTASGTPPADQPSSAGEENAVLVAILLNPSDLSAMVGQEFRADLSTSAPEAIAESTVTVSYDPTLVEFRRVEPGGAAISARATDGQVMLTVRRPGAGGTAGSVLAMLFFQAKAKGDATLTMEATPREGGQPPRPERVVIHVQ